MDSQELIRELSRPAAWRHEVEEVEVRQTHISLLFFAGDRVFKVKRSIQTPFLDYRSLDDRRHFCAEEVRLNRCLAPATYRGVVPIVRTTDGHLRVDGVGEVVEWAVEMDRLPESRMLDRLLAAGEIDNSLIDRLAVRLATFHESCPTDDAASYGSPAAIGALVRTNVAELASFAHGEVATLTPSLHVQLALGVEADLIELASTLQTRLDEGRVRDGHGDLHAGNICLPGDEIVIYDAIEFSPAFRVADVAADLAFLVMDLDFRGFSAFGRWLVRTYEAAAGDPTLSRVLTFYKVHRALVRAKVASHLAADLEIPDPERAMAATAARRYVHLALAYRLKAPLILLCGLPGSGKSTIARHLARPFEALTLHSDAIRKSLAGVEPTRPAPESVYSAEWTESTYRELRARALASLASGRAVIVDATLPSRRLRLPLISAAVESGHPWVLVQVDVSESEARARLLARSQDHDEISDADWRVHQSARRSFEPPNEVPRRVVIDSTADVEANVSQILNALLD